MPIVLSEATPSLTMTKQTLFKHFRPPRSSSARPTWRGGLETTFHKKIKNAKDQTLPDGLIFRRDRNDVAHRKALPPSDLADDVVGPSEPLRPARHPASLRMPTSRSHARTRAHTALTPTTQRAPSTQRRIHRRRSLRAHAPLVAMLTSKGTRHAARKSRLPLPQQKPARAC